MTKGVENRDLLGGCHNLGDKIELESVEKKTAELKALLIEHLTSTRSEHDAVKCAFVCPN